MPEYLSPGVFIEEVPARLKAIEGVSTSTAGLVGASERGTVAGLALPYTPAAADVITLPLDPAPVLVTSFADFVRQFGPPLPDPATNGYLGHAARAFFDNGGKRAYVARVTGAGAARANLQVHQGVILRLARRARGVSPQTLFVANVRDVAAAGTNANLRVYRISDGAQVGGVLAVTDYDVTANTITVTGLATDLEPDEVYLRPHPVAAADPAAPAPLAAAGPKFYARSTGAWGGRLAVTITSAERPPTPLVGTAAASATSITVQSTASVYRGAIVRTLPGRRAVTSW